MQYEKIENIQSIINQIDFKDLQDDVKKSDILEEIMLEIYNGWPGPTGIDRINEKIQFISEVLPVYSNVYGKSQVETLEILAKARNVDYTNWFQNANIPKDIGEVNIFANLEDFVSKHPHKKFICPSCSGHSTDPYECNVGDCNWKVYGLFRDMGRGCSILFMDSLKESPIPQRIFRPITMQLASQSKEGK